MNNVGMVKDYLKTRGTGMQAHAPEGMFPLIVVDGKELGNGTDILSKIPVGQIQSITVLKNEAAKAEYGDKAKDGVIKITTKKKEN